MWLVSYFAPISSNVASKFQVHFLSLSTSFTGAKLEVPEIFSGIFFIPNSGSFSCMIYSPIWHNVMKCRLCPNLGKLHNVRCL